MLIPTTPTPFNHYDLPPTPPLFSSTRVYFFKPRYIYPPVVWLFNVSKGSIHNIIFNIEE